MSQSLEQPRFGWLDGFILTVFAASGIVMAVLNDRAFFDLLPSLASHQAPWQSLPDWVADLELPCQASSMGFSRVPERRQRRSRAGDRAWPPSLEFAMACLARASRRASPPLWS